MSQADFHLGGKKIPGWALALSERATGESAWCLLGLTGFAFAAGLSAVWIAVGCVSGIAVSWLWLAKEFRRERDKYNTLTLPDYLATKYAAQGKFIRWFSSVIIIFFFVLYVAAQFSGGGKTLNITFGIPVTWGIIISAVVVIIYAMAGGFFSVVWTDVLQAILMIITLVVTPIIALIVIGRSNLSITTVLAGAGTGLADLQSFRTVRRHSGLASAGAHLFRQHAWAAAFRLHRPVRLPPNPVARPLRTRFVGRAAPHRYALEPRLRDCAKRRGARGGFLQRAAQQLERRRQAATDRFGRLPARTRRPGRVHLRIGTGLLREMERRGCRRRGFSRCVPMGCHRTGRPALRPAGCR